MKAMPDRQTIKYCHFIITTITTCFFNIISAIAIVASRNSGRPRDGAVSTESTAKARKIRRGRGMIGRRTTSSATSFLRSIPPILYNMNSSMIAWFTLLQMIHCIHRKAVELVAGIMQELMFINHRRIRGTLKAKRLHQSFTWHRLSQIPQRQPHTTKHLAMCQACSDFESDWWLAQLFEIDYDCMQFRTSRLTFVILIWIELIKNKK